jgi:hypothetical protein
MCCYFGKVLKIEGFRTLVHIASNMVSLGMVLLLSHKVLQDIWCDDVMVVFIKKMILPL